MKSGMKIKILIAFIAVILVTVTSLIILKKIINKKNMDNTVYVVKKETYENVIEIAGTVEAAEEQTLQAKSDGTVLGVYVNKGDKVSKGDIIIQLDDTEQKYNLAKLDYDMASSRINGSKKELELQEKQRLSLVQKIEDRKVVATFDGIIADLDVSVGDSMEAKDSVGTLVNTDYLVAEVEVAETDVGKLAIGQEVDFTFPAYNGTVKGYIVSWPRIGTITSRGATVVNVKIRIDDYPESILPNFSFTGKIQITDPEENLIIETNAVQREKGKAYVIKTGETDKTYVRVIPYGKNYLKVIEGLEEGDTLKALVSSKTSGSSRNRQGPMDGKGPGPQGMGAGGPPPMH